MGVKLVASSGGSVEFVPANTASNFTVTVPAGTGTVAIQGVSTNIVSGTAVASTSGTSISFTDIPSWVKRITVMFSGISTNGSSLPQIQIGSGSFTTSGYLGSAGVIQNAGGSITASFTAGFGICSSVSSATVLHGTVTMQLISGNSWVAVGNISASNVAVTGTSSGSITLGGTLDRVRITTVNGTDTFDAGSINILYE